MSGLSWDVEELIRIQEAMGLSTTGWQKLTGIAPTTMAKWRRGKGSPMISTLVGVLDRLEMVLTVQTQSGWRVHLGGFQQCMNVLELERLNRKQSSTQFAALLGMTQQQYSRYLTGVYNDIHASALCRFAGILGWQVMFTPAPKPEPEPKPEPKQKPKPARKSAAKQRPPKTERPFLPEYLAAHGLEDEEARRRTGVDVAVWEILMHGGRTVPGLALIIGQRLGMTEDEVRHLGISVDRETRNTDGLQSWYRRNPWHVSAEWWTWLSRIDADAELRLLYGGGMRWSEDLRPDREPRGSNSMRR